MASVLANSLAMLAARLLVPLFSFAINLGIARVLGAHELGQYVQLIAILLVVQALAGGGLTQLVTRDAAARPAEAEALARRANVVGTALALAATAALLAYQALVLGPELRTAAGMLALSVVPSAWIAVQEGLFMAAHRHYWIAVIALVEGVVKLAVAGAVLLAGGGLVGLCIGLTLARLVALGLGAALTARLGLRGLHRAPGGGSLAFARELLPFAGIFTLAMLYFRQDVLVVGALRSEAETGLYGVAATLYAMSLLGPTSVMSALFPRLAASHAASPSAYRDATVLSAKLLAAGGVAATLVLLVLAGPLVRLLYGAEFEGAVPVLGLLFAILPLHGVNTVLGQALQAAHLQGPILTMTAAAVAVNLVALFLLVPQLGIAGGAWSLLLTSGISLLWMGAIYHRHVSPLAPKPRQLVMPFALAGPIVLVLASPERLRMPAAAGGLVLLAAGALLSGLVERDDLARLLSGLRAGTPAPADGKGA